jgi:hypothetical protein
MTCNHQWQEAGTSLKPEWACIKCKGLYSVLKRMDDGDDIQGYVRPWVDLTRDQIALLHADYPNPQGFALALQSKLKELNT